MLVVVLGVLLALGDEGLIDLSFKSGDIALWVPVDKHRANLRADKVVGAAGAEVR